ncbi:MAG: hypothetical protein QOK11_557 [Pseudonocardiales bacterium]|nr:hypothetical protein [Pseudonocardiales bacterium]
MGMTTALIVNIALDAIAFSAILGLAFWAIKTGERDAPGQLEAAPWHVNGKGPRHVNGKGPTKSEAA